MPLHLLNNIEIQMYLNYEPWFNGIYLRDNLLRIKDGALNINLDEKQSKGKHRVSLVIDKNTTMYIDSFVTEYTSQEVLSKIKDKSIAHSISSVQSDDLIMCGFYCIASIEHMIARKTLLDCNNLFFPDECQKKNKMIYIYIYIYIYIL